MCVWESGFEGVGRECERESAKLWQAELRAGYIKAVLHKNVRLLCALLYSSYNSL